MLAAKVKHDIKDHFDLTYEDLIEQRYIIVGSPETGDQAPDASSPTTSAPGSCWAPAGTGSMPHWQAMKCLQIMAEEVIPHFREPDGKPTMREDRPGATTPPSMWRPSRGRAAAPARFDGDGLVETELAYIPEVLFFFLTLRAVLMRGRLRDYQDPKTEELRAAQEEACRGGARAGARRAQADGAESTDAARIRRRTFARSCPSAPSPCARRGGLMAGPLLGGGRAVRGALPRVLFAMPKTDHGRP